MIQGKLIDGMNDLTDCFYIREKVFIEEQKVPRELEMDDKDKIAVHAIVYDIENKTFPVATGRIYIDGNECRIGRVAVLKEYRGKGYGDFVVRLLVNKALSSNIEEVTLHAQTQTKDFYKKIGFIESGEVFYEAGISHIKMLMKPNLLCGKCSKH